MRKDIASLLMIILMMAFIVSYWENLGVPLWRLLCAVLQVIRYSLELTFWLLAWAVVAFWERLLEALNAEEGRSDSDRTDY